MLIRVVRDLTPEEVMKRVRKFEREFSMRFSEFEQLFLEGKLGGRSIKIYFEWRELVDSYEGYIEDGQLDYSVEEIIDLKPEKAVLLTPKRIELLYDLASLRVESINDLSGKIGRDIKNVHQDLQALAKLGFVRLNRRKGRAIVPETPVKEVTFLIR